MILTLLSRSALWTALLALPATIYGQTFTTCDPIKKAGCPDDPAIGSGTFVTDFTKGADDSVFSVLSGTPVSYSPSTGALFSIQGPNDAPTMQSNKYLFFGRLDVEMLAAAGQGIVTSIVLQSDDLDELDWEWVGGDTGHVQTNYFHQGNTTTYDRGATFAIASPMTTFHIYSIVWTADHIQWLCDGAVLRTVTYQDAYGGLTFPQTPMRIKLGTWVGGKDTLPKGTVDWAGGMVDWSQQPFNAYYKTITVTDYSNGVANAVSYSYDGMSGTFQSIKVNTGKNNQNADSISVKSAAPSATQSPTPTSASPSPQLPSSHASSSPPSSPSSPPHTPAAATTTSPSPSSTSSTASNAVSTDTQSSAPTHTVASSVIASSIILPSGNANSTFTTLPTLSTTVSSFPVVPTGAVGRLSTPMLPLPILGAAFFLANMLL